MSILYSVKAIAGFEGEVEGDLSLNEGDILQVIDDADADWFTVYIQTFFYEYFLP